MDLVGSNTGSKYYQLQYSTDNGASWTNTGTLPTAITSSTAWATASANLSSDAAVANNPNFGFRVISVFDPDNGTTYSPIGSATTYNTTGTFRVDNVTVIYDASMATVDVDKLRLSFVKNTLVHDQIHFGIQADIQIFNMNGQMVKSARVTEGQALNVADLHQGIYIVKGVAKSQTIATKIVKD